jgi:cytochrome P450
MANDSVSSAKPAPPPPVAKPPVMSSSPIRRVAGDAVVEWRGRGLYPPGPGGNTVTRTLKIARDPLPILLGGYEEFGPIFTLRLLHTKVIFMLGPEANHYVTVSHPENFHWRESSFGDLIPLLGDGLLTIDDDYHDSVRATMMPAFHREQVAASVEAMIDEATPAIEVLRTGEIVDIYAWMRRLAMRIAMRALLGLDPDEAGKGAAAAEHFERALEFYGIDFALRFLRGPGSPWRKMLASREVLDEIVFAEIAHRRQSPDAGRMDVLSLLLDVRDEAGEGFSDREVRDQLMTLMFAGHDTSTSTLTFMMYELARRPDVIEKLQEEQDRVLGGAIPDIEKLEREMPYLDQVLDEVLRLYPPAWIGPRRAVREFEFNGHTVPEGAYLNYCSWASHRIPEFFPEPEAFRPERFTRERKAALPRGAYVPFGGGKRICIGKRFGQIEVKLVATMLLQKLRLDLLPGRTMTVRQMPTLSPRGGLPMRVDPRRPTNSST